MLALVLGPVLALVLVPVLALVLGPVLLVPVLLSSVFSCPPV